MAAPLLSLQEIALTFGGTPLLTSAEMFVHERSRLCLIGRNGSGKSTLLKIAAGLVEVDKGERFVKPGVRVCYLEQEPDMRDYKTVADFAAADLTETDEAHRVPMLLQQFGLAPDADPQTLSGGEARRAALVRVMAPEPDILLLDEPTNHLDLPMITWLEQELARSSSAIVVISHDRRFLQNLTRQTLWLDRGETKFLNKGFADFESWRDEVLAQEELDRHKLDRKIVAEEHWLRYGVTARRKRNVRRLGELHQMRQQRREATKSQGGVTLATLDAGASGKLVIEVDKISKAYGDKILVKDFSIRINRGDRIGFAGPNGIGKTTLLNMLIGKLTPDSGMVRMGTRLELITLDQKRAILDPETRLMDALTGGRGDTLVVGGQQRHVMGYLKDFLFTPEQARTPIKALSGGERARLALAITLAQPSNMLVLDEPTNDLDLETLDLLQEMLVDYPGTVLLVSHDRDFLDRTVTSIITPAFEQGQGCWLEYPGGWSDMAAQRKEITGAKNETSKTPKQKSNTPSPTKPKSAKLSYKDKYALENLPKLIAQLEQDITNLQEQMADENLFMRDPALFAETSKKLAESIETRSAYEDQWLELEEKRESLENGS